MPAIAVLTRVPGCEGVQGTIREKFYDISFISDGVNANYVTTGFTIFPDDVGLVQIFGVSIAGSALVAGTAQTVQALAAYDYKLGKLQLFGTAAGATGLTEIANTQSIATFTYRLRIVGT